MQKPGHKLDSVIEALASVRQHVANLEGETVPAEHYNRSIAMLNALVEGDWDALVLEADADGTVPAADMIMNLDAAIAFLEEYRETTYAIAS